MQMGVSRTWIKAMIPYRQRCMDKAFVNVNRATQPPSSPRGRTKTIGPPMAAPHDLWPDGHSSCVDCNYTAKTHGYPG